MTSQFYNLLNQLLINLNANGQSPLCIVYKANVTSNRRQPTCNQTGSVLITALIFLAIMATLAASSMQATTMSERLAGNVRDKSVAFQAAEATIRAAENKLLTITTEFTVNGTIPKFPGQYPATINTNGKTIDSWRYVDTQQLWGDGNAVAIYQKVGSYLDRVLAQPPSYVIEEIKSFSGSPPIATTYYRITARAIGLSSQSEVVLQSTFYK